MKTNNMFNGSYDSTRSVYSNDTRVRGFHNRASAARVPTRNHRVDAIPTGSELMFQPKTGHDLVFYNASRDAFYRWSMKTERVTCIPSDAARHNVTGSRQVMVTNSAGRPATLMLDTELAGRAN